MPLKANDITCSMNLFRKIENNITIIKDKNRTIRIRKSEKKKRT